MRIELTPQAAGRAYPVREIRNYVFLALGAAIGLLAAGALLVVLDSSRLINAGALALVGIGVLILAVAYFWRLRKQGLDDVVYLNAPYAFDISETTFEFPGTLDQESESWPRSATQVRIETRFGQDRLHLENPEMGRRVFPARVLAEPPVAAVDHILGREREAPRRGAPAG